MQFDGITAACLPLWKVENVVGSQLTETNLANVRCCFLFSSRKTSHDVDENND